MNFIQKQFIRYRTKRETDKLIKQKQNEKAKEVLKTLENEIYEDVLKEKIANNEVIKMNSIHFNLLTPRKTFLQSILNMIPIINLFSGKNENFTTLALYFNNYNLTSFGISENYNKLLKLFEKEKYVIKEEKKQFYYKGKRILFFNPKSPINLDFDIDKNSLLCDSETCNSLIDNVVEHKLTNPVSSGGISVFDFVKKNWLIIGFVLILLYLIQTGKLESLI